VAGLSPWDCLMAVLVSRQVELDRQVTGLESVLSPRSSRQKPVQGSIGLARERGTMSSWREKAVDIIHMGRQEGRVLFYRSRSR
jgi:hypothetical protein